MTEAKIVQKVRLAKLKTGDGNWDFSKSGVPVGTELYVQPATISVQKHYRVGVGDIRTICMLDENGIFVPVEVLEFLTEFEVKV
jgi:hypothetical protein